MNRLGKSFLRISSGTLLISVRRDRSTEASRIGKLIHAYLKEHSEIRGIRGLAEKVGLSYHAVQKYANGSSLPPLQKLKSLLALIEPTAQISDQSQTLFDRSPESNGSDIMKNSSSRESVSSAERNDSKVDPKSTEPLQEKSDAETTDAEQGKSDNIKPAVKKFVESAHYEDEPLCDDQEIFVPIHGFVRFTDEEMEVINHPAFQRLGEIYQLGQAHLVYRGATHKRLEHSLGSVHVAEQMMATVSENHARAYDGTI
jgi:hypothetical protein